MFMDGASTAAAFGRPRPAWPLGRNPSFAFFLLLGVKIGWLPWAGDGIIPIIMMVAEMEDKNMAKPTKKFTSGEKLRRAFELGGSGKGREELAAHCGVNKATVQSWMKPGNSVGIPASKRAKVAGFFEAKSSHIFQDNFQDIEGFDACITEASRPAPTVDIAETVCPNCGIENTINSIICDKCSQLFAVCPCCLTKTCFQNLPKVKKQKRSWMNDIVDAASGQTISKTAKADAKIDARLQKYHYTCSNCKGDVFISKKNQIIMKWDEEKVRGMLHG